MKHKEKIRGSEYIKLKNVYIRNQCEENKGERRAGNMVIPVTVNRHLFINR